MNRYVGNALECLKEAQQLSYAYFSPELDNFGQQVKVEDIVFKVEIEMDLLDEGHLKEHAKESMYAWDAKRNETWRKKAVEFVDKWKPKQG